LAGGLLAFVILQFDDLKNRKRNTEEWQQSRGDLRDVLQNIQPEGADDRGSGYREILKCCHGAVANMTAKVHLTMAVVVIALIPDAEEAEIAGSDVAYAWEKPDRIHIRRRATHPDAIIPIDERGGIVWNMDSPP
jgi:hypothetical protein